MVKEETLLLMVIDWLQGEGSEENSNYAEGCTTSHIAVGGPAHRLRSWERGGAFSLVWLLLINQLNALHSPPLGNKKELPK